MNAYGLDEDALAEQPAIQWLKELGYQIKFGPDISPGGSDVERASFTDVILTQRLKTALKRLNPHLPQEALDDAYNQITRLDSPDLYTNNHHFHLMTINGVKVEILTPDGDRRGDRARIIDFENPENNDFLVVNQFTIISGESNRRPDMLVFINGIPIANIEVKNPGGNERAIDAYKKNILTYKKEIPELYHYNEIIVVSDTLEARHGTITADWEWYTPWRTMDDEQPSKDTPELETLIQGLFDKPTLLDIIQNFIVFETHKDKIIKKMAMHHQYYGVNKAIHETLRASAETGDHKIGVIWHTQGSGKSLSMVFFTGKIIKHPTMKNPTVLVLTDRNDLDNQIHGNFCLAKDVIPYPKQAETVEDLKEKLNIPSGGIIFTTIQKFQTEHSEDYPQLSERKNIIVIVDEAHRSQYKTLAGNVRQALPNASFIGFTGTPIELRDRSTRVTFGDYISVYTMRQSRQDGNTVPIYYQGRLAKLHLTNEFIDEDFDRITETEEDIIKEKLKSRWAQFEALVGTEERLQKVAHDIVEHFNNRGIEGKAMVVCTSRRIAVRMHEIIKGITNSPMSAVVITKPEQYGQPHLTKQQRDDLKEWFKDPKHPLKMVIVRDMWLTGYDAPVLHTMYVDKPMKDHTLMQAIARVNRVFRDKPGGLIVDYIGIADDIKKSLGVYDDDVQKESMISIDVAVSMMLEKYDIVKSFFHDVDYSQWWRIEPTSLTHLMQKAHNAVTTNDEIKERFLKECIALSQVYAMVSTEKEAITIRKEILFFQAVRRSVKKYTPSARDTSVEIETSIKQLVSEGISASEVQDIFGFTGEGKRDISILDDDFLKDIQRVEYKNLQVELLKRLINDDISLNMKKNIVQYRSFKEMLEQTIARYSNRSITSAQVIDLLIKQAKELREIPSRAVKLGLTEDEIAFYDAVARGKTHIDDDQKIREIAKKLVVAIKGNLTIDWADRENVKSKIRANVKRILRQEGFTPQEYEPMVPTIMDQAVYLYADYVPMSPEFNVPMGRF